ncbi:MAG: isopeptide-forming domain-containing fimbrial protein [bacterium]
MRKEKSRMKLERIGALTAVFAIAALSVLLYGTRVVAVGTSAGTIISNQAYVDYQDANGNALTRVYSNTVTTTVSQVAGVDIVPPTATDAGNNSTTVQYLIQIFNTGNGTDSYSFNYVVSSGWTPTSVVFYYDANNNHIYEAGTDPLMTSPYSAPNVPADDDYDIFMMVTIPNAVIAPDASTSVITVTATSVYNGAVTDFGTYTTQVAAAVVTAAKSHTPASPKPGDIVTYTVTLTNGGSTNATTVVLRDAIPANLSYVPGTIIFNGTPKTDTNDGDGADYNFTNAGEITVSAGTINSGGGVATVVFQATVDTGVPAGTAITNQASVNYNSGPNPVTISSNGNTLFVATSAAIDIAPLTTALSGDPGDQIVQKFTVTNKGNANDIIDLTSTSSVGWTWVFWVDQDGDGLPGTGGDYLLTDTDGDGKPDTGSLPQSGTISILAVATIPPGTPDGTVDTLNVTATSSNDITKNDTQAFTTTVTAPVLSVTKSVSPTGTQPPGTDLVYTITVTNSGTGVATNVVITDNIPANTTYKLGTLLSGQTLGGLTVRTDANDGDGANFDSVSNNVALGTSTSITIGPGGTQILRFTVTIN